MSAYKVTSEIFTEKGSCAEHLPNGGAITEFLFKFPSFLLKSCVSGKNFKLDDDDDLDICRQYKGKLAIEHNLSTELELVGLQLWRGAFLLADYILSNPDLFRDQVILELGSGVGFTSIVASFLASEVISTDINTAGLLQLIHRNFLRNKKYVKSKYSIEELNFHQLDWPDYLAKKIDASTVVLAADVIYDDAITDGFVNTLAKILNTKKRKIVYIALEKRFVFTVADLDMVAPMYEEFLRCIDKQKLNWTIENLEIDFPCYFEYERVKQMILMKIQNNVV